MKINRDKFYKAYREQFGAITKDATVKTIEALLTRFEKEDTPVRPAEKFAYMFATVRYEVGPALIPIVENMNYTSIKRIREVWPSRFPTDDSARPYVRDPERLGNKVYGGRLGNGILEGYKFRGRGIGAQLTGHEVYKKFGDLLGIDMVNNPDLAMDVDVGAEILYRGLTDGTMTGAKLSRYINNTTVDYINARRTVNADVARSGATIAKDAKKFEKIFKASIDN